MAEDRAKLFENVLNGAIEMLRTTQQASQAEDKATTRSVGRSATTQTSAPAHDDGRGRNDQPRSQIPPSIQDPTGRLGDGTMVGPPSGYNQLLARVCIPIYKDVSGNRGPQGPRREPISEQSAPGAAGTDGKVQIARGEMRDLVSLGSLSHFSALLRAAEYDYLRDDRQGSLEKLIWLLGLTKAFLETSDENFETEPTSSKQIASALRDRAGILTRRIDTGLDYFGEPEAFVPRLNIDFYKSRISELRTIAGMIEDAHRRYFAQAANQASSLAALRNAIEAAQLRRQKLEAQLSERDNSFSSAQSRIHQLREELDALWAEIFEAEADFKKAVADRSGCDFQATLMFASAVATAISTGGASVPAVLTAAKSLGTPTTKDGKKVETTIDYFDFVARTLKPAGKSLSDFGKAYGELKSVLENGGQQGVPNFPSDQAKFIVAKNDFDEALRPFLDMNEAQRYKQLADNFVALAETRNNLILEADTIDAARRGLESEIRELGTSIRAIQVDLAANTDPRASGYAEFMERANMDSKRLLAEEIYRFARAYSFFALRTPPRVRLADFSVASLMSSFQQIDDLYARAKEQFGRSAQPFRAKTVSLFSLSTSQGRERFFRDGILTVSIPVSHPEFRLYGHIKVTRSFVQPVFGRSAAPYQAIAIHHGQGVMRDMAGEHWMHIHQPVPTATERGIDGEIQAGGEIALRGEEYEGVSPFATWTLRIRTRDQATKESIKDINLVFEGYGRPIV